MRLLLLLSLSVVVSLVGMDDDFHTNNRRFLISSGSYTPSHQPKASDVVATINVYRAASDFDKEKPFLWQQLEVSHQALQHESAPAVKKTQPQDFSRFYGCDVPYVQSVPERQSSPVRQRPSFEQTVSHPLISSGGLMPE